MHSWLEEYQRHVGKIHSLSQLKKRKQKLREFLFQAPPSVEKSARFLLYENYLRPFGKYVVIRKKDNPDYWDGRVVIPLNFEKFYYEGPAVEAILHHKVRTFSKATPAGYFTLLERRLLVDGKRLDRALIYVPPYVNANITAFKKTFQAIFKLSPHYTEVEGREDSAILWSESVHPYVLERSNPLSRFLVFQHYGDNAHAHLAPLFNPGYMFALLPVYQEVVVYMESTKIKLHPFDVLIGKELPRKVEGSTYMVMPLHTI